MEENGIELADELIIRREIFQNGRSVSRINGQMVNLSTLKAVGHYLVDIHGQHDQEELMKPNMHILMLDEFGNTEFNVIKNVIKVFLMLIVSFVNAYWISKKMNKRINHVLKC